MRYGRERDIVSQSPRPESCFGDVTSLAPGNDEGCSKQTIIVTAAILLVDKYHLVTAAVSRALVDQRSGICLDSSGSVHLRITDRGSVPGVGD